MNLFPSNGNAIFSLLLTLILLPNCFSSNIILLGDSYAAGNGGNDYEDRNCYRSANCWGKVVADTIGATTFINNACSGSEISDLSTQNSAISSTTDLVLVTAGANDLFFPDILLQCFQPAWRSHEECTDLTNRVNNELSKLTGDLKNALIDIFDKLHSSAVVVLVAYPHITLDTAYTTNCCGFSSPNSDIIKGLRDTAINIDDAQRSAVNQANSQASRTFAYFYDGTKALFDGHEPHPDCDRVNSDGWILDDIECWFSLVDEESYHPTERGHSELGGAVAQYIASLGWTSPPNSDDVNDDFGIDSDDRGCKKLLQKILG